METKTCQNCKKDFIIEQEDFNFYEKIKVPPPTFCPECRTIRRLCWRNEMSLFKRKCNVPGHKEELISFLPPEENLVVYDGKYWWGDEWNPLSYGQEYDFKKPFFEQWKKLRDTFPQQTLSNIKATNSDYCNVAEGSKDSYLCSGSWQIERTYYGNRIATTKDCSDLYVMFKSELCYDDVVCAECYKLLYSFDCKGCVDSCFLYDCIGCINCFGCSNLRNESYCMWNEQLTKEEYFARLKKIDLKSYSTILKLKEKFKQVCLSSIHRFSAQVKSVNSTGDNLDGARNCKMCFDAVGRMEDIKYSHWLAENAKDVYDSGPGIGMGDLIYEAFDTGIGNFRNLFTSVVYSSNNIEYSFNCHGCDNLFGCIGLRTKKYCILNKQYSKEEYEKIIPKIKKQMMEVPYLDKRGLIYKYGEFFPAELSPFCYNETQAQDYFPKTKENAIKEGYRWRENKIRDYQITLEANDLPDNLENISDSILDEVIGCLNRGKDGGYCRGAFRITEGELNLYKRIGVPIPRFCFFCRHKKRLLTRRPLKLWHRACMCQGSNSKLNTVVHHHDGKCRNEFETPYSPDRPETIYCEKCYQKEVY
jgi:hypothetical protein